MLQRRLAVSENCLLALRQRLSAVPSEKFHPIRCLLFRMQLSFPKNINVQLSTEVQRILHRMVPALALGKEAIGCHASPSSVTRPSGIADGSRSRTGI